MKKEIYQSKLVTNVKLFTDFMQKNNLTKTKFARSCGISLQTLNKLLSGNCDVKLKIIIKLVKFMKISADDIAIVLD